MCPEITSGLLAHLERMFPDKAPRSDAGGLFSLGKAAGAQDVLDYLRTQHKQQQEAIADVQAEDQHARTANPRRRASRSDGLSVSI